MATTLVLTVGELIRKARKDAGLLQADLAVRLGVSEETISRWERNVSEPSVREAKRIALATGADWFWGQLSSQLKAS